MSDLGPLTRSPASHIYFSQRLRLHYIDWGSADAPPMLMVHGVQDHCRTFDELASHFYDDYHVLAPDLRGHGDSQWLHGASYRHIDYLYDLHQLVVQADLGPVTLVAHSLGGAVAAAFAGAFPELVARLVLIEAIGLWRETVEAVPMQNMIREWVDHTRALSGRLPRRYESVEVAAERMRSANPQLAPDRAYHLTIHGSNQNEDGTYSWKFDNYTHNFLMSGLADADTVALWQQIQAPTLLINADQGLEHRAGQNDTLGYFQHGELVNIADASHWTYHDQPEEVVAVMQDFFRRHPLDEGPQS